VKLTAIPVNTKNEIRGLLLQHRRSWHGCGGMMGRRGLASGLTQGRSADVNRLALVSQAAEHGLGEIFIVQQAAHSSYSVKTFAG
jgi:hypothetical protein